MSYNYNDILRETRKMVSDYMSQFDPSHDMYHIDRVSHLALCIAKDMIKEQSTPVDLEVVELAALCHDIDDHKYKDLNKDRNENVVKELLINTLKYPKGDLVMKIIDHIGYTKEKKWNDELDNPEEVYWRNHCLELHAVQDADKLDAIGAIGILRCAAFSGARNLPLYVPENDCISSAITHFHEKLFNLKSLMRTSKGKELATERHRFMQQFVHQIQLETL
ncbi:uncharacterized protein BX663DRAFT_515971 [Cokeromyces recurvatus]|uniref:uncharacterized protein n=1 Tax=Cokeromyces recurvatus TaxID=90255 RepID=UPI00221E5EB7|nr:uncharacterized protein BX663DRAFT_515971 [Cokeromyces recurvatus]KAI7901001.1 hypothetical protein BX663DRAFT_515971 [Cokeromyces recurvatus]